MFEIWKQETIRFINNLHYLAFIAIITLLSVLILLLGRYIIKNFYNVNAYKKKIIWPIFGIALLVTILILIVAARY